MIIQGLRHLELTARGPLVLLFFDGLEIQAYPDPPRRLYAAARATLRSGWRQARGRAPQGGFYLAFAALRDALRGTGCDVRVNDFAAARARPGYPIGLAGHPSAFARVALSNPAIFGPGDPGHPDEAGARAASPTLRRIIQPSSWYVDLYRPWCGDKMMCWPAPIDTAAIPDTRGRAKSVDVLIYDKLRWDHDAVAASVIAPLTALLDARGLTHETIRYGHYLPRHYAAALGRARTVAFVCEHETQGLACEQAMAANLPVFAWDEGRLADPMQQRFVRPGLAVTSVPYFDARCGMRFTRADLAERFDVFWAARAGFAPRAFVEEALAPAACARAWLTAYDEVAGGG